MAAYFIAVDKGSKDISELPTGVHMLLKRSLVKFRFKPILPYTPVSTWLLELPFKEIVSFIHQRWPPSLGRGEVTGRRRVSAVVWCGEWPLSRRNWHQNGLETKGLSMAESACGLSAQC